MNELTGILKTNIENLILSRDWLKESHAVCSACIAKENYTSQEFANLEAYASRFARLLDILIKKVFRSLDIIEYGETGTLIDAINKAEKRGLIPLDNQLRTMKDIRNQIAHEYIPAAMNSIFQAVWDFSPLLISYTTNTVSYAQRYKELDSGSSPE